MNHSAFGYTRNRSYSHQVQPETSLTEGLNLMASTHRSLDFEFNLEDHIKKTRKAATYLKQVFHSQQCGGTCASPHCRRIHRLLRHIENECQTEQCAEPGCVTTKKLLRHSMECQSCNSPCSTSFLNTPTLNASKGSSNNNVSRNLNTHLATTPSNQFCLLCTIARTDTAAEMAPAIARLEDAMDIEDEDDDAHGFDRQFMPIISDEIIEFSRIPFQQHGQRVKTMSHDGINSVFRQPISSSQRSAMSPTSQPTAKKARSKSLNAVSFDVLALQPLQGTMTGGATNTAAAAPTGF